MSSYRPEPKPATHGMLNRSPSKACPLCQVWGIPWNVNDRSTWNQQHIYAEALWQKWNPEKKGWTRDLCQALEELDIGLSCTEDQARNHYRHHRPEQPALSGYIERERAISEALALPRTSQEILLTVYRQQFLSTKQIQELFFSAGRSERSAKQKTSTELTRLARQHMLYRYFPSAKLAGRRGAPQHFAKQALWFLGKKAAPFIEQSLGLKVWSSHYVQMAKSVDENIIIHDLLLSDLYVRLHKQIRDQDGAVELPDGRLTPASLNPTNWYSDRHLSFGFFDRLTQQSKEVAADAFATLSIARPSYSIGDLPSCQLPFFLEYDRGSKVFADVASQLLSYHLLAVSRAAGKRFEELDADGYAVPIIMVFSDAGRMLGIQQAFRGLAEQIGLSQGAPILLASEEDWLNNPLDKQLLLSAWHDPNKKFYLIDILLRSSRSLIKEKIILPRQPLTINMKGASRSSGGSSRASTLAEGRRKLQAKRVAVLEADKDGLGALLAEVSERRRSQLEKKAKEQKTRPSAPSEKSIEDQLKSHREGRHDIVKDALQGSRPAKPSPGPKGKSQPAKPTVAEPSPAKPSPGPKAKPQPDHPTATEPGAPTEPSPAKPVNRPAKPTAAEPVPAKPANQPAKPADKPKPVAPPDPAPVDPQSDEAQLRRQRRNRRRKRSSG